MGISTVLKASSSSESSSSFQQNVLQSSEQYFSTDQNTDIKVESEAFIDNWINLILFSTPIDRETESEEEEKLDEEEANDQYLLFFKVFRNCPELSLNDHVDTSPEKFTPHFSLEEPITPRYLFIKIFRI